MQRERSPISDWRCCVEAHWGAAGKGSCQWNVNQIHLVYTDSGKRRQFAHHPELGWYRQANRGGGRSLQPNDARPKAGVLAELERLKRENQRLLDENTGVYRPVLDPSRSSRIQQQAWEAPRGSEQR